VLRFVHRLRRPHILVLAYHRVTPDAAMADCAYPAMHVAASTFRAQLQALRRLYRVVPMRDLRAILAGRTPLREPVAVITFDDGYRDNYEVALPILAAENIPATFFVSVDFVERGVPFWFDRLAAAARAWDGGAPAAALPEPLVRALSQPGTLAERLRVAAAFLKTLPDAEREAAVAALDRTTAATARAAEPMSWNEVRALREAGMHVGAHGVRHGILTRMPVPEAAREIGDSLATVAARIGDQVTEFAYPNGDADAIIADLARDAGVHLAFTMAGRAVRPGADPLRIARRNVSEDTSCDARGRFSQAYFWCEITGVFDVVTGRRMRAVRRHA
jgi:peptidoglycan/xylan/chitin deacetylase (PgdA/CDA1 family)